MGKLNTKIQDKPILATLLIVVIIGLICFIIFTLRYYQPQIASAPVLKIDVVDMEETLKLEPVAYDWIYKGEQNRQEIEFDPNNFDYSNCTIYDSYSGYSPMMKTEPKLALKTVSKTTYMYNSETGKYEQYESDFLDFKGKVTEQSVYLKSSTGVSHIYVSLYTIGFGEQGFASYVVKVVEQDDYRLGIIKEYKGITLDQKDRLKELLSKLSYGIYLEDVEVNEGALNLIYKYRVSGDYSNNISIALFSLIDDLEEITYTHLNKNFVKAERNENDVFENKPIEYTEPRVVTREELAQNLNLDWNNLKEILGM